MSAPILTANPPGPLPITPNDQVTVEVLATDPDASTSTLRVTGTDEEGNAAVVEVTVLKSDPIQTWAVVALDDGGNPDPDLIAELTAQSGTGATAVVSWPSS